MCVFRTQLKSFALVLSVFSKRIRNHGLQLLAIAFARYSFFLLLIPVEDIADLYMRFIVFAYIYFFAIFFRYRTCFFCPAPLCIIF